MRTIITILLLIICTAKAPAQSLGNSRIDSFDLAVAIIKHFEGWHDSRHYPYIGYGHRIQPGEHIRLPLTRRQADRLLRSDLRKLCRLFSYLGKDSLLVATLAYNVGSGTLLGTATRPRSTLIRKLEQGNRHIRSDYLRYCHWNGKIVKSIRKRRMVEWELLWEE